MNLSAVLSTILPGSVLASPDVNFKAWAILFLFLLCTFWGIMLYKEKINPDRALKKWAEEGCPHCGSKSILFHSKYVDLVVGMGGSNDDEPILKSTHLDKAECNSCHRVMFVNDESVYHIHHVIHESATVISTQEAYGKRGHKPVDEQGGCFGPFMVIGFFIIPAAIALFFIFAK